MSDIKKHIGESKIGETPKKVTKIRIAEGAVTTDKLADQSVTVNKLAEDVTLAIEGVEQAGLLVSQELGDNETIGISQKKITEVVDSLQESIRTLDNKQDKLIFDDVPVEESENPVTSDGIKSALSVKANASEVYSKQAIDNLITETRNLIPAQSSSLVITADHTAVSEPQTNVIYREPGESSYKDWGYNGSSWVELAEYDNALDDAPTKDSNNLAKSGGIYAEQKAISDTVDGRTLKRGTLLCQTSNSANSNGRLVQGGTLEYNATAAYKWIAAKLPDTVSAGDTMWIESKNNNTSQTSIAFRAAFFTKGEGENVATGDSYIPGSYFSRTIYKNDTTKYVDYIKVPEGATHICLSNYYEGTASTKTAYTYAYLPILVQSRVDTLETESADMAEDIDDLTWNKYTVMAGFVQNNVILDARTEVGGETNLGYGNTSTYAESNRMATHFLPLMGCDKCRIYCQLTSDDINVYNIDGVVAYDDTKTPLPTPIKVVEQGAADTFGYVEWVRDSTNSSATYIRYTVPLDSSNDLSQHLPNVELWFNMKSASVSDNMLSERSITLTRTSTTDGGIGEKGVLVSDGSYSNVYADHAYLNIPSDAQYLIVNGKLLHNTNVSTCGAVFRNSSGSVIEVLYKNFKITGTSVTSYSKNGVCVKIPDGAKQLRWTIADGTSSTTVKILKNSTEWKSKVNADIDQLKEDTEESHIWDEMRIGETLEYIHQAKFLSSSSTTHDEKVLGLIHYSDWHGDKDGAQMILDWADRINAAKTRFGYSNDVVNDILNTGDVVPVDLTGSGAAYYFDTQLPQRSLFTLGNHDQKGGLTGTHDDQYYFDLTGDGEKSATQDKTARENTVAASHVFSFERYFEGKLTPDAEVENPLYSYWDVTMPEGYDDPDSPYYRACYWHKDYSDQKVRLIGVDCMYRFDGILKKDGNGDFVLDADNMLDIATGGEGMAWKTTEQETWLYNLLMDAITNNYSVVIASHAILDSMESKNTLDENGKNTDEHGGRVLNYMTGEVVNFEYSRAATITESSGSPLPYDAAVNMRNREVYAGTSYGYRTGAVNNMGDIIQKFIDNGGKFVAWLCGHTHSNHFFYPGGGPAGKSLYYPDILNVTIERAGNTAGMNGTAHRATTEPSRIAANYYAVDTTNGLFKIVRLGLTTNRHLRSTKYLVYDYINKKVVSEG